MTSDRTDDATRQLASQQEGRTSRFASLSLAEARQEITQTRIRRAAMEVVAKRGFDATVDEIAKVSGVSPRTIFRHYASHDRLIAATVKDMFEACGLPRLVDDPDGWVEGLPRPVDGLEGQNEVLPRPTDDLDGWIDGVAVTFHTRSAEIFGAAFWDLHALPRNSSEELSEVDALRRDYRLRGMTYLVNLAWRTAGGAGDPPESLALAFFLNLSPFTTQALMADLDQTPAQIGLLTGDILKTLLHRAVKAQRSSDDESGP